jgi:hypothetical protein
VLLNVVCVREGGYPFIYTIVKAVLLSIFSVEARDALPQHEAMPTPEQGVAEGHQKGGGRP